MNKFTMYSKPSCPVCVRVKDYFDTNDVEYDNIDVSVVTEGRNKLVEAGFRTVPQIYKDGVHFGDGETTLKKLKDGGKHYNLIP